MNEVVKAVLNFLFCFTKRFRTHQKHPKAPKAPEALEGTETLRQKHKT